MHDVNRLSNAVSQLSAAEIASALTPFSGGHRLSDQQIALIRVYVQTLLVWNQSISLTAIVDPLEIVTRHFGESLFAAFAVPIQCGRLADIGAGAGFPGLPLRIFSEKLHVVLLEPNLKKCAFLTEITQKLHLDNVEISRSRYEQYRAGHESFDFVCSRALGDYRLLLRWAKDVLRPDGRAILWLGTEESIRVGKTPGWSWDLPIPIPESRRRVILVGRPKIT